MTTIGRDASPGGTSRSRSGFGWHCLAACWPLLAGTAAAQPGLDQPATILAETDVEVRLVELDVRVTDGAGKVLRGLQAEDFVLRVDGEEVPIEHFAFVDTSSAAEPAIEGGVAAGGAGAGVDGLLPSGSASETGAMNPAGRSRQLIVYLDQRFLDGAELVAARLELLKFLRRDVPVGTRVMLASADEELSILQAFTSEPALVADALQSLQIRKGRGGWRMQFDLAMQEVQRYHDMGSAASADVIPKNQDTGLAEDYRSGARQFSDESGEYEGFLVLNQGENKGRHELIETDPRHSLAMIESFDQMMESGLRASSAHLARLVGAASGLPGETSVLYVGGTLPVNATRTLFELWQDTYGTLTDDAGWVGQKARDQGWRSGVMSTAIESGARFGKSIERLEQVADLASAAGLTFYTLDVSVPGRLGRIGGDAENFRSGTSMKGVGSSDTRLDVRSDAGAIILADRTGGRTEASRSFERFFDGLAGDLRSSYTLAFSLESQPREAEGGAASGLHDVEVRLRRDAVVGRARLHHRRKIAVKSLEQEQVERTVSALAMNLELANPLGIEVVAGTPRVGEDGQLRVPLSVKVPMANLALIPDRQAHAGRLSIYIAVGGLEHGMGLEKAVVPVRIANRDLLTAFGRSVDYRLEVSAPVEATRLAVTVRDDYRPARSTVVSAFGTWDGGSGAEAAPTAAPAGSDAEGPL